MSALTAAEIEARLADLPGWRHHGGAIRREFTTTGWPATMLVVNAIAWTAEAAGHHPDLTVTWSRVEVALWTHSAGGVTALDFEAAALIDRTVLWRPEPGTALRGPPSPLVR